MWAQVGSCGLMWAHVGSCGLMWAHVGSCGLMWAHVGSCGLIWCVRLLFGRICDGGMIPAWGLVLPPSGMIAA